MRLFLIGFGHVGQGFADLLVKKHDLLKKKYGLSAQVVGIATRSRGTIIDQDGIDLPKALQAARLNQTFAQVGFKITRADARDLITSLSFDVLIELSYTNLDDGQPATDYIKAALKSKKQVITTNKGPIALHLPELEQLAKQNQVTLLYEGTVMAGTPLISLLKVNLAGLEIKQITGILNGSCNYILTRMEQGLEYEQAVEEARALGYLEANPVADVEGWDAQAKVMILSAAVFKQPLKKEEVQRQGITHLTKEDVERAGQNGKVWKLIANLKRQGGKIEATVKPELLDTSHSLAHVQGVMNAVTIYSDYLKEVTISGPGAGEHETGFAVLNDLIRLKSCLL